MDDDQAAAEDERAIELSSIAAIYPELIIEPKAPFEASLEIPVAPTSPLKIHFQALADGAAPALPTPPTSTEQDDGEARPEERSAARDYDLARPDVHHLSYLPPLALRIRLPNGYPTEQPPAFKLSTPSSWLQADVLEKLQAEGSRLWEELGRDQVVFTYIDHLQQAAENAFGLATEAEYTSFSQELKIALLDFDMKTKREKFEQETFDCGICLEPKKGVVCHRLLLCSHVFCVSCLRDFYRNAISEGDVDNVKCLAPNCSNETPVPALEQAEPARRIFKKKRDRTLNPSELLQIPLEQEVVQRYVFLKRKKKLESDKNTIYCPRQWCQGAARSKKHPKPTDPIADFENVSDSESEIEREAQSRKNKNNEDVPPPMSERLAVCEDCDYAFCSVCKKGWHGELGFCRTRKQTELNEEEKASLAYLQLHSTPCPTCSAPCQKSMGCNHMICFKCRTHFCYLCSSYLEEANPYKHFNTKESPCYMRLWELEEGDGGEDVGLRFGGGADNRPGWDEDLSDSGSDTSDGSEEEVGHGPVAQQVQPQRGNDNVARRRPAEAELAALPRELAELPRDMRAEVLNFVRAGVPVENIHIERHDPARAQQPAQRVPNPLPPAPNPPNRNQRARIGRRRIHENIDDAHALLEQLHLQDAENDGGGNDENDAGDPEPVERAAPAPGQGNHWAQQPAPVRAMGLERFLQLAAQDQEDEWDSDELDEEEEAVFDAGRRAANANRDGDGGRRWDGGARGRW